MESALIISDSEKDTSVFSVLLNEADISAIKCVQSCESANKLLLKQNFDLIIIDPPLSDESGESFSRYIAGKGVSQVIITVKEKSPDYVFSEYEKDGILTISKPIDKIGFRTALSAIKAVQSRVRQVQEENTQLKQKIEDIRIIDRAKCLLISYMRMSEQESHRYIEKQAMDMRSSRRIVAEGILKRYENF
jgi:two-component system, response regulator PdtaR